MMVIELGLFFFVLLGSKIVMGAVAVYMLVQDDDRCALCDAAMLPIEHTRGTDRMLRTLRMQRRWCMECGRETLTRRLGPSGARRARSPLPVPESRLR